MKWIAARSEAVQGLAGVALVAVGAGMFDYRIGLASAGAAVLFDLWIGRK